MKKGSVRRSLSLLLAFVLAFGVFVSSGVTAGATLLDNKKYNVVIKDITYKYPTAKLILDQINAGRAKYPSLGLTDIKMDSDLMDEAMKRAAQLPIHYSPVPITGEGIYEDQTDSQGREDILVCTGDPTAVIEAYLTAQAQIDPLLSTVFSKNFTSIGIGAVNVGDNEETFIIIRATSQKTAVEPAAEKYDADFVPAPVSIEVLGQFIQVDESYPEDITLHSGDKRIVSLKAIDSSEEHRGYSAYFYPETIFSGTATILSCDTGWPQTITGVSEGDTTLTLKMVPSPLNRPFQKVVNVHVIPELVLDASVSPEAVTAGEPCTITADASGGTETYEYSFTLTNDNTIINPNPDEPNKCTFTPTAAGDYDVTVTVDDGVGTKTKKVSFTAAAAAAEPSVTLTPDSNTAVMHQPLGFTIGTSDFPGDCTYSVTVDDQTVTPTIENGEFSLSFDSSGKKTVEVTATDGTYTASASVDVNVTSDLAVSLTTEDNRDVYDTGETVTFVAEATGGVGPYTYVFKSGTTVLAENSTGECSTQLNMSTGFFDLTVEVTDGEGTMASKELRISVIPVFVISLSTDSITIPYGGSVKITAYANSAYPVQSYSFAVGDEEKQTGDSNEFTFTGEESGTHTIYCTAYDNLNRISNASVEVTVLPELTVGFNNASESALVDTDVTIPYTITGGSGTNICKVYVDEAEKEPAFGENSFTLRFDQAGTYTVKLSVNDGYSTVECSQPITIRPAQHTVTFDAANGSETTTDTVNDGGTVTAPAAPEKIGYVFKGWFNGDTEYDFSQPVTDDVELTAHWGIFIGGCSFTVEGYSLNNIVISYDKQLHKIDVTVTDNDYTLVEDTDYTITGNSALDSGKYTIEITGIGNYGGTKVISWEIKRICRLTYSLDESEPSLTEDYKDKTSVTLTAVSYSDKQFSHWYDVTNNKIVSYSQTYSFIVMNNLTIKPVYVNIEDTVKKESVLTIDAYKAVSSTGKNSVRLIFNHSVPYDCTISEIGIRFATNKRLGYESDDITDLTIDPEWGEEKILKTMQEDAENKMGRLIATYSLKEGTVDMNVVVGDDTGLYIYAYGYFAYNDGEDRVDYTDMIAVSYESISQEWSI